MKKKYILTLATAVFITALILPDIVSAQAGMQGYGRQIGGYPGQYAQMSAYPEMRLTAEQLSEQNRVWSEFQNETIQLRTDIYSKQMQINSILNSENPDVEKIKKLQNELNTIKGEFAFKRIDKTIKLRKILTPEQRAVFTPCYNRVRPGMIGVKGRGSRQSGRGFPGSRCMMW